MPNYGSSHLVVVGALDRPEPPRRSTWWWSAPWTGLSRPDEARTAARCLPEAFRTYTLAGSARSHSSRDASFAESYLEALRLASVPE